MHLQAFLEGVVFYLLHELNIKIHILWKYSCESKNNIYDVSYLKEEKSVWGCTPLHLFLVYWLM